MDNKDQMCVVVANYIVKEINKYNNSKSFRERISLSNRRLQLLLYFCEIEYMRRNNGIPLFEDDFMAWPHGPTITKIASLFAQYFNGQMNLVNEFNSELTDDVKAIIHELLEVTKDIDTLDLINISNVYGGPWYQVYNKEDKMHQQIISKEEMYSYYLTNGLEIKEKNIPTSVFNSMEEADKLSDEVTERMNKNQARSNNQSDEIGYSLIKKK